MEVVAWQSSQAAISSVSGCDGDVDSSVCLQHELAQYIDSIPVVKGTQPVVT
jgi:hypothetical protein